MEAVMKTKVKYSAIMILISFILLPSVNAVGFEYTGNRPYISGSYHMKTIIRSRYIFYEPVVSYAQRIQRFYYPMVTIGYFDYYDPVFTDTYWYSYDPVYWGTDFYINAGWNGFSFGFSFGYPVYRPLYSWGGVYAGYYPVFFDDYYYRSVARSRATRPSLSRSHKSKGTTSRRSTSRKSSGSTRRR